MVVAFLADQHIVAGIALDGVVAQPSVHAIVAAIANQPVVAGMAADDVDIVPAMHGVVAAAAAERVPARAAVQEIGAVAPQKLVIAPQPRDRRAIGSGGQRVMPLGAKDIRAHVRRTVMGDRKQRIVKIAGLQGLAVGGLDHDGGVAELDLDAIGLRTELQLPDRADHPQQGKVQRVLARGEIRDDDMAIDLAGHEGIGTGTAHHGQGRIAGDQDVVASTADQRARGRTAQHHVIARGAVLPPLARDAGDADLARVKDELRDPPFRLRCDEQHDLAVDHLGRKCRDIGHGAVIGIRQRDEMQKPAVGREGKDADPVIATAHENKGAPVYGH